MTFPITEVLDLLAIIRGQKGWSMLVFADVLDDAAGLQKFAAAQIRSGNVPQRMFAPGSSLEVMLQAMVDAHNNNGALNFDLEALIRAVIDFALARFFGR